MTTFVKNFIQHNKELINKADWTAICDEWLTSAQNEPWYNDSLFSEFCSIMNMSRIPFFEESVKQREDTVRLQIQFAFDHYIRQDINNVRKDNIQNDWLCTKLGLTEYEVKYIADEMAKNSGYKKETDLYYVKDLF